MPEASTVAPILYASLTVYWYLYPEQMAFRSRR